MGFGICKLMLYKFLLWNKTYFVNLIVTMFNTGCTLYNRFSIPSFWTNSSRNSTFKFLRALILYLSINSLVEQFSILARILPFPVLARILPFFGTHTDSTLFRYSPGFYHFFVLTLIRSFSATRPEIFSILARNVPFLVLAGQFFRYS